MARTRGPAFLLYHWSPTSRRKQINRLGLRPSSWSTDRLWKPPYICFSASPSLAWGLSGGTERGGEHEWWDLWMVWSSLLSGFEEIPFDDPRDPDGRVKEYRVYERVYKRDLWYVGSRARDA